MKPDTQTRDILAHLAARTAKAATATARARAIAHLDALAARTAPPQPPDHIGAYTAAAQAARDAAQALARIPRPRRDAAAAAVTFAEQHALAIARRMGGDYSGAVTYSIRWHDAPRPATAATVTGRGDQYSSRCTYRKTDAAHIIRLDPSGVFALASSPLLAVSARDGLPLVSLKPDGSAVWIVSKGKQIEAQAGWIVGDASTCYHSTKSREHAAKGYQKKLNSLKREQDAARQRGKEERRARLIARLCGGVKATLADAKALGFCDPGIRAFQASSGIGDEAPLPQLIRTGNPSAVRLALHIARQLKKAA